MFETLLIKPLYNGLLYLIGITGGDFGLAIILLTLLMRAVFYPGLRRVDPYADGHASGTGRTRRNK